MGTDDNDLRPLSSVVNGSLSKRASSNLQQALDDRMILSEAIEAATRIIRCYPSGGANIGDSYIGALAHTLAGYPRSIALRCADPAHGIARECRGFSLPQIADVVVWCERATEPLRGEREREIRVRRQLAERAEHEAVEQDRSKRLNVSELKAKYGDWTQEMGPPARRRDFGSVRQIDASELTVSPYLRAALARQEAAE